MSSGELEVPQAHGNSLALTRRLVGLWMPDLCGEGWASPSDPRMVGDLVAWVVHRYAAISSVSGVCPRHWVGGSPRGRYETQAWKERWSWPHT